MREPTSQPEVAQPVPYVQGHMRTWNDSWQGPYAGWNTMTNEITGAAVLPAHPITYEPITFTTNEDLPKDFIKQLLSQTWEVNCLRKYRNVY